MPFEGMCPYWHTESRDRMKMKCELCIFTFPDLETRREMAFAYCADKYRQCTIYKILSARDERGK